MRKIYLVALFTGDAEILDNEYMRAFGSFDMALKYKSDMNEGGTDEGERAWDIVILSFDE